MCYTLMKSLKLIISLIIILPKVDTYLAIHRDRN